MASELSQGEELAERPAVHSRTRRNLLKALGVAAAGAIGGGVLSNREAEAHGKLHVDNDNIDPAIHGNNTSNGPGAEGTSLGGPGVHAKGTTGLLAESDSGPAVRAENTANGAAVSARSHQGPALYAYNYDGSGHAIVAYSHGGDGAQVYALQGTGISAHATIGDAINAFTDANGTGVRGRSAFGNGVEGTTGGPEAYGVYGASIERGTGVYAKGGNDGTALAVDGIAKFSTAGSDTVPLGQDSRFVSNANVTAKSHITVTLTGTPGAVISGFPAVLQWVERQPGNGFVIHLTRRVGQATPFTYLIVEPG